MTIFVGYEKSQLSISFLCVINVFEEETCWKLAGGVWNVEKKKLCLMDKRSLAWFFIYNPIPISNNEVHEKQLFRSLCKKKLVANLMRGLVLRNQNIYILDTVDARQSWFICMIDSERFEYPFINNTHDEWPLKVSFPIGDWIRSWQKFS